LTAYHDKFAYDKKETNDEAFEDLDPMLQLRDDFAYTKERTPPSFFDASNPSSAKN
jgi:hypothetical protein